MKSHLSFAQVVDADLEQPAHANPSVLAGGCWVCGVQTSQQCAPCAAAGFVIRFCSPEHQRLVWPAHKTVCGAASASFAPRPLTSEQYDAIVANRNAPIFYNLPADDVPFTASLTSRRTTVARYVELQSGISFREAMTLARQDLPASNPRRRKVLFACQDVILRTLCGLESPKAALRELGWVGAFTVVRFQLEFYRHDILESIHVQILHRALILAVLTMAISKDPHDTSLASFVKHSMEQFLRAALAGMRLPSVDGAVKFLRSLAQVVHPVVCARVPWITVSPWMEAGREYWTLSHVTCWLDFSPHEAGECPTMDFLATEPGRHPPPAVFFPGPPKS